MNILKSIPVLLLSFFSLFMFVNLELAHSSSFSVYETKIFHESNESKVKKLQEVFKWLWLYEWEISWIWQDIEEHLINYQIEKGIVPHKDDEQAWYFGVKTMKALENEFWELYKELKEEFLKADLPSNLWKFQITAYYTPLPWQAKYTTWSYEWDKRLNWNHTTASWLPLEPGLLAAPRNYPFGTKIYLDWIGVWIVWDRWWAIINSGERWNEYDRLDIWVWYWDEWRERARKWGRRELEWYIVDKDYIVNVEFDGSSLSRFANLSINPNSLEEEKTKNLQTIFKEIWLYEWEIDWIWDNIKDIFLEYQISRWIITSANDEAALYFWPKTYKKLSEEFWTTKWNWLFKEKHINNCSKEWQENIDKFATLSDQKKIDMESVKQILEQKFDKIFKWNKQQIQAFKKAFSKELLEVANREKYMYRRLEFEYLTEILK